MSQSWGRLWVAGKLTVAVRSVLCVASVGLGGLWGRTLGFGGEEQVERHRRARFPRLMVGCTWPRSPTMPRGSAALPHVPSVLFGRETLEREEQEKKQLSHPAHFGPRKYCLRECICEVEGQVPCPGLVPLPKEMTGKYRAMLKASAQD